MSSSSIRSSILFVSSILLLFSTSRGASLIEVACAKSAECIELLESDPKVESAKTYKDLALKIMESGSRNATRTRAYLDNLAKKASIPSLKVVFETCNHVYDSVVFSYESASQEVETDVKYGTADYDLFIVWSDVLNGCIYALESAKITDPTLLGSNHVMPMFGRSAVEAIHQFNP